jgi:alkanesulfonate monooxygenase SsuD/methylene tetrahydromethanopterin reductase-like flavin-dependent oxidoreductase (luciferase family)
MHHTISYHLAQARIADLCHHAQRATMARAVLACARRCFAGPVPFLAPPWPLSPPRLATHPLAESAPPAA